MTRRVARARDRLLARLASSLQRVAKELHAWSGAGSHRPVDGDSAPTGAGAHLPEPWVALLRERAPHLLHGGLRTYQTPVGPRSADLPPGPARWPAGQDAQRPDPESPSARPAQAAFRYTGDPPAAPPDAGEPSSPVPRPHQEPREASTRPPRPAALPASPPRADFRDSPPTSGPSGPGRTHDEATARPQGAASDAAPTRGFETHTRAQSEYVAGQRHPAVGSSPEPDGRTGPDAAPADRSADRAAAGEAHAAPTGGSHATAPTRWPLRADAAPRTVQASFDRGLGPAEPEPPPPLATAHAARAATTPKWVSDPPREVGGAVFEAPREAEGLWPALPPLSATAQSRPLDDAAHLARLEREQEGS